MQLAGSEDLKKKYLGALARGEGGFSYCLSEPDAGSDAVGMKTRAVRDGDTYVLNGVKRWITNAGVSEFYTVMAVTDPDKGPRGISAFVVEKGDEGVSFGAPEKKLGIKGSPTPEVYLDDVRIPADRMIGAEGTGFETAMRTLDHTGSRSPRRRSGSRRGAGLRTGLRRGAQAVRDADQRLPGLQFLLADMGMRVEAARQMTYAAAGKSERGDSDLTFFGAAAKCFASDVAMEVTTNAVQVLGGCGYTRDYPVERMMRDAKITQIYEGTNQVQRIVIARQLPRWHPVPALTSPPTAGTGPSAGPESPRSAVRSPDGGPGDGPGARRGVGLVLPAEALVLGPRRAGRPRPACRPARGPGPPAGGVGVALASGISEDRLSTQFDTVSGWLQSLLSPLWLLAIAVLLRLAVVVAYLAAPGAALPDRATSR